MSLSGSDIAGVTKAIEQYQRLLVIPHANVDPDGLSAALACYLLFQSLGKEVTVVCPDTLPESLRFLPGFEKLHREVHDQRDFVVTINLDEGVEVDALRYTVEDHRVNIIVVPKKGHIHPQQISLAEGTEKHDLIVVVDTADLPLLGSLYTEHVEFFTNVPVLNIDHHISNTRFGQLHLIDPTAASATEVLYSWWMQVPALREKLTPDIATLLLTGLITDTRSFQNPNTTPRSLEVAAELLEKGARQQEIVQHIYKTKPLSTLRVWGRALNRIQIDPQARIVWSAVSTEDLLEMGAQSRETHGILDELLSTIPDADVHVLFTEVEEGGLKASLRSSASIDASKLAATLFSGGGHARAAGFRVRNFSNFQLAVLECVQKLKEGMRRQQEEGQGGQGGQEGEVKEVKETPAPEQSAVRGTVVEVKEERRGVKEGLKKREGVIQPFTGKGIDIVQEVGGKVEQGQQGCQGQQGQNGRKEKGQEKDVLFGLGGGGS